MATVQSPFRRALFQVKIDRFVRPVSWREPVPATCRRPCPGYCQDSLGGPDPSPAWPMSQRRQLRLLPGSPSLGQIENLSAAAVSDKNVCRLDVSVDDAF